jgi:hypothetical protein
MTITLTSTSKQRSRPSSKPLELVGLGGLRRRSETSGSSIRSRCTSLGDSSAPSCVLASTSRRPSDSLLVHVHPVLIVSTVLGLEGLVSLLLLGDELLGPLLQVLGIESDLLHSSSELLERHVLSLSRQDGSVLERVLALRELFQESLLLGNLLGSIPDLFLVRANLEGFDGNVTTISHRLFSHSGPDLAGRLTISSSSLW